MIPPTQPFPFQIASGPCSYIVNTELVLGQRSPFLIGDTASRGGQVAVKKMFGG